MSAAKSMPTWVRSLHYSRQTPGRLSMTPRQRRRLVKKGNRKSGKEAQS